MPASLRFVDPVPGGLRGKRLPLVTPPAVVPPAAEPAASTERPTPTETIGVTTGLAIDDDLVRVLLEPLAPGETPSTGFARKEAAIVALLDTLDAADAVPLHDRLATPRKADPLAAAFGRLSGERRARLLEHLRDAPRREFLRRARRCITPAPKAPLPPQAP